MLAVWIIGLLSTTLLSISQFVLGSTLENLVMYVIAEYGIYLPTLTP